MILIEHILGNVKKDPVWQEKLKDATFDLLVLDQREAQKSRCRKLSTQGLDLGISLDRHVVLADGDVLAWDEKTNVAVVVQINLRDVMVIDLSELKSRSPDELIKTCFELGHALGNQHWKAVTKNNEVYVPLTVATTMMDSVMRTHGFQHLPFRFVKGRKFYRYSVILKRACYLAGLKIPILMCMSPALWMNLMAPAYMFTRFIPTAMGIHIAMTTTTVIATATTTINTDSGREAPQ